MRQVKGYLLWLGHVGDVRDPVRVINAGVVAVVDLAMNEPMPQLTREMFYFRCPLIDGAGNDPWLLRLAVRTVSGLIRENVPTLVYCSAGMSRSPSIVAAAIADVRGISLAEAIKLVTTDAPKDISPSLLADLQAAIGAPA